MSATDSTLDELNPYKWSPQDREGTVLEHTIDLRDSSSPGATPIAPRPQGEGQRHPSSRVMTPGQRVQFGAFAAVWIFTNIRLWTWWVSPGHVGNPMLYTLVTAALFYTIFCLPCFYLLCLGYMRRPVHVSIENAESAGVLGRIAVVTLTVPGSESINIVARQLIAMASIEYPHDSWILVDKVHSPEIKALAEALGVHYFCRHDTATWGVDRVAGWNAPGPPFQAKTKAGNVNAWLDAYGGTYSHFTQLDIDHIPQPRYLHRVLGYFKDRRVAWVQAPSVYGNLDRWTARGSAEQDLVLQGPMQMGFYGFSRTPFIIGSHCTYDMAAIESIGGFQPTRAEDHLDTVFLAAAGKEGVFVPEVIAIGDGPETFETYLAQQFAWAYSMMQVLFGYSTRVLRLTTFRQAFQFFFVQSWYTFWSVSMLVLFMTPVIALVFDVPVSRVSLGEFWYHSVPVGLTATGIWLWSRRWHQPTTTTLTWRGVCLHVARWVTVLSALVQVVFKVQKPYMITRKGLGRGGGEPFPLAALAPYIALVWCPWRAAGST